MKGRKFKIVEINQVRIQTKVDRDGEFFAEYQGETLTAKSLGELTGVLRKKIHSEEYNWEPFISLSRGWSNDYGLDLTVDFERIWVAHLGTDRPLRVKWEVLPEHRTAKAVQLNSYQEGELRPYTEELWEGLLALKEKLEKVENEIVTGDSLAMIQKLNEIMG